MDTARSSGEDRSYGEVYRATYGFEATLVAARQRLVLELLASEQPGVVVEFGCGLDLLSDKAAEAAGPMPRWVIVEPDPVFARAAATVAEDRARLVVIERRAEEAVDEVLAACDGQVDLVVCSSLLHEVPDDLALLGAARALLGDGGGLLHVNVPNAGSLHRRLAREMELIGDVHDLSARNRDLGQHRVYDIESLETVLTAAGFASRDRGGYFLKPFTNDQMQGIEFLGPAMLDGLWRLGRALPELASEIFVNAAVAP